MEIERKFLVKEIPNNLEQFEKFEIKQGYISTSPVIRIRKSNESFYLTCKGKGNLAREEWEIEILGEEFCTLWHKIEGIPIEKSRYLIPIEGNQIAMLDIFHGKHDGLQTVEVEFDTIEQALFFVAPPWFGIDVTDKTQFKNSSLSKNIQKI